MIRAPSQKGFQDLTDPTRKVTCGGFFLAAAEEKLISTGGASQNPDPARSRTKASEGARISDRRSPGDRDHQDRGALLPLWVQETHGSGLLEASDIVGSEVILRNAVCMRVVDARTSTKQENAP
ncbi:LOW QUALITY PROTEIN: hypothetical protein PHMEG_00027217 [Phytophthora megakarya]|uniref:Uncharacterized protein n=1 Tax=Phytophthora megakarya TaxID=4795 RepID=A0A225V7Q4_9STRA|nr:LOW QUALITY PROTEIN: hypothetical protein PHMEG_00027217 [Phytophthora megakarya]